MGVIIGLGTLYNIWVIIYIKHMILLFKVWALVYWAHNQKGTIGVSFN